MRSFSQTGWYSTGHKGGVISWRSEENIYPRWSYITSCHAAHQLWQWRKTPQGSLSPCPKTLCSCTSSTSRLSIWQRQPYQITWGTWGPSLSTWWRTSGLRSMQGYQHVYCLSPWDHHQMRSFSQTGWYSTGHKGGVISWRSEENIYPRWSYITSCHAAHQLWQWRKTPQGSLSPCPKTLCSCTSSTSRLSIWQRQPYQITWGTWGPSLSTWWRRKTMT